MQTKISVPISSYFTHCTDQNLSKTIFTYDGHKRKAGRLTIDEGPLDFKNYFTIQVNYDIYGFKNFYASVSLLQLSVTNMAAREKAPPLRARSCPSLVNFADKYIFVIAGCNPDDYRDYFDNVDVYSIETDSWASAPALNTARMSHSSCMLQEMIYTFCGSSFKHGDLNSIERLNARDVTFGGEQGNDANLKW